MSAINLIPFAEKAATPPSAGGFYDLLDRREIPALNGLRAIAAFVVVTFHFAGPWFPGRLGVVLFFVLSGFLITWLLLKELESTTTISLLAFYKRRSLRIFPAFYCFWTIQVALISPVPWPLVLSCAAYASNYYIGGALRHEAPVMNHTWSLAVEEQFYLIWPAILLWQRLRLKRLAWYLGAVVLLVQVVRVIAWQAGVNGYYIAGAFEMRCDALALGCLGAIVLRERPSIPAWLLSHRAAAFSIAALLAISWLEWKNPMAALLYGFGPAAIASALLIAQSIALSVSWPFRILNHPTMSYLGRISYPIYLYHTLVLKLVHGVPVKKPFRFLIGVLLLILVASASYFIVERPFLGLKRPQSLKPVCV